MRAVTAAETATALVPDPGFSGVHEAPTVGFRQFVGFRGGVFELAFADFPAVGVDRRVQGRRGLRERRRWFGHDRRGFGRVLNVSSEPLLVPPALVAVILKW